MFKNLKDIPEKEIIPGFKAKFVHSKNMTFAYWNISKDAILPEHYHKHEQVANILEGRFKLIMNSQSRILKPGEVAVIPSNVKHSGQAITKCRILDVFFPMREDYR